MTNSSGEIGIVKEIREGRTIVELQQTDACDSCGAKLFCRPGKNGKHEMAVLNSIDAKVGEMVELDEMGNLLLLLSFLQYGIPLLGLLSGIFIIYGIKPDLYPIRFELVMSAGGFIGLLLGGVFTRIWARHLSNRVNSVFKISAILKQR
ncbi:MAG: SoxR reducing system RseC family protein [Deltaproteobacteria bacterium]|jgi:positive regulator of sigma E activity|nr:SoxR reducing system RseC family protein [Deltaproteobacteria bacterium]MBT4087990.1 SoxR reducing system RseC family protein [Deltaproteobacteria bacterium]MBT4639189.1 SoxR reducing system RseC family protein [Deltaproteobacteria bacterium]MBT6498668.1 SoxR reducing system RseC family protein [Deltaproteobacteria bacterium]MBT6616421.1 SoxR reducing system RseC family protein [Deltaproteobacteria bacterium]